MNKKEQSNKMGHIIAKALADEKFKQKLIADPAAVMTAEGIEIPTGVKVRAVENTDKLFHIVIPPKPDARTVTDDRIKKLAKNEGVTRDCEWTCLCHWGVDWSGLIH